MAPGHQHLTPPQDIFVLPAEAFPVVSGANEGDALSFADDVMLDDVYSFVTDTPTKRLVIRRSDINRFRIMLGSDLGRVGATLHLDSALALMALDGPVVEVIVLVEVDTNGGARDVYLMPLVPLDPKAKYRLVGIDRDNVAQKFAQSGCVSFARGTRITLGSGKHRRVEELRRGDPVLTRDDGVQPIRWIGKSTQRALGSFAPVRFAAGTLNNAGDLLVSRDHRLFVHQRSDRMGADRAVVLVKAHHLVNGSSVTVQKGGFIDYYQLLFDSHQIIYAEGIATESMLVDDRTAALLESDVLDCIVPLPRQHRELSGTDVQRALTDRPNAAKLLRRAAGR